MTILKNFFFYLLALFMVIGIAAAPSCTTTTSPESPVTQQEPPASPPAQVPEETELKYDDNSAEDCLAHGRRVSHPLYTPFHTVYHR